MDRRAFIQTSVRTIILAVIAAISAVLLRKTDNACAENPFCKTCGTYDKCSLPQKQTRDERKG